MSVTVHVNGSSNSLVHKGSNGIAQSTIPDVCKTPSPGGPVPVPYPVIISMSSDLENGSTTVTADGGNMIAIKDCDFSRCTGDEAGTAGGVTSSTFGKEAKFILYSFDVKIDGGNACRLSDKMTMNHQNTMCLAGVCQAPVTVEDMKECEKASQNAKEANDAVKDLKSAEDSFVVAGGSFVPSAGSAANVMGGSVVSSNMVIPGGKYTRFAKGVKPGAKSNVPCKGTSSGVHEYTPSARAKSGHAEAKILEDVFARRTGGWKAGSGALPQGKLYLQVKGKPVCCECQKIIACAQSSGVEVVLCPPSTEDKCP